MPNKELNFRVLLGDADKSVRAIYTETLELAYAVRDRCLAIRVSKDWDMVANAFFRTISRQFFESKVTALFLRNLRKFSKVHSAFPQKDKSVTWESERQSADDKPNII